jgi:hypothetical protein
LQTHGDYDIDEESSIVIEQCGAVEQELSLTVSNQKGAMCAWIE